MARHDAGWWAERVAEFTSTGEAERIARRHGVTVKHLKWWRWKLRADVPKSPLRQRASALRDEPRLLPVVVSTTAVEHADEREPMTIIETSRGRIQMRGQLTAEQLGAIVAELVRGC